MRGEQGKVIFTGSGVGPEVPRGPFWGLLVNNSSGSMLGSEDAMLLGTCSARDYPGYPGGSDSLWVYLGVLIRCCDTWH